ncbi:MAG TPA: SAM domain-containing protein, partial [Isosphaeraceae bacterium]|nr:SAM domain-containing protein [Isosphaeraceae bacterium]
TDWLEKLGLGQYAQRLAENDISFSVLSDLTDQDLKEIGVSLGHRRQLLRAITELTGREKNAPKAASALRRTAKHSGQPADPRRGTAHSRQPLWCEVTECRSGAPILVSLPRT